MATQPDTPLLTPEEVKELLRLKSTRTLENWRATGRGPRFVKIGTRVCYRREDVLEYIESNVEQSTSGRGRYGERQHGVTA